MRRRRIYYVDCYSCSREVYMDEEYYTDRHGEYGNTLNKCACCCGRIIHVCDAQSMKKRIIKDIEER